MSLFNKNLLINISFILAILLFPSSAVMAQETMSSSYYSNSIHRGPYLAAGIGPNIIYSPEEHLSNAGHFGFMAGANLLAGYQFNNNWAAEIGTMFSTMIFQDVTSWYGAVKGILPYSERFFLFGKLGIATGEQEWHLGKIWGDVDLDFTGYQKTGLFLGIGMEWGLTNNLGLTLSYDAIITSFKYHHHDEINQESESAHMLFGLLSLGLIYHFPM